MVITPEDILIDSGNAYPLKESIGWIWRNVFGVSKANPCNVRPLSPDVILNTIQSRIRLGFLGDIMPLGRKALTISSGVRLFFDNCDYLVGNMEGTITRSSKSRPDDQRHDPSILRGLALLFPPNRTFLSVANNHAGDFPAAIFKQSIACLEEEGFHVFGLKDKPFADIGGSVRVMAASMWSNKPCRDIMYLDAFARYGRDSVFWIAYPHWGYEMEAFPRPAIVNAGIRLLQTYGAVLGHHPHVPQPATAIDQCTFTKLLAFSLGNFCTDIRLKKFQFGSICTVDIGPANDGSWQIGTVRWRYTKVRREADDIRIDIIPELSL